MRNTGRAGLTALGWGWAVLTVGLGCATADPGAPVDPVIPAPAPAPQSLLGQVAAAVQTNPLTAMTELLASSPQPPAVGVAPPPGTAPAPDPWAAAQLLMPQNYRMPTDDQLSPYALAPNDTPSPFARIDAWKGVHALLHGGLGRMPGDELGQPLPGTAAPPGSNLPPGLEQFYVDPALLLPPPTPPTGGQEAR